MRNFLILLGGLHCSGWPLIFYGSAQPTLPSLSNSFLDLLLKYGAHFIEYAVLALLWYRAIYSRFPHAIIQPLAFVIVAIYALSDELHQTFVPGRSATWQDVAVDLLGGASALLLWNFLYQWRKRTNTSREEHRQEF